MTKGNDLLIPDYSSFHREISETSSPINHHEEPQVNDSSSSSSSSSSIKQLENFQTMVHENNSSAAKLPSNAYASTDEDVDELYLDDSESIDRRPMATIQNYRDRLNARVNNSSETILPARSRLVSTEHSQITHDSGVDILSEQKVSQAKIDEHCSERTTNQNESDDSLLDIETPHTHEVSSRTPPLIVHEQSISLTDELDGGKSYLSVLNDYPIVNRTERALNDHSEPYFSAESDFNTSLVFPSADPYSGYELENITDDEDVIPQESAPEMTLPAAAAASSPPRTTTTIDFQLPTFGDWIDQVFTTFLAETHQQSASTSRSSSIVSIHTSQNTIDTSSSQVLTVIENKNDKRNLVIISRNSPEFDTNHQARPSHRRSLSWPNEQVDEQKCKGKLKDIFLRKRKKERKRNMAK